MYGPQVARVLCVVGIRLAGGVKVLLDWLVSGFGTLPASGWAALPDSMCLCAYVRSWLCSHDVQVSELRLAQPDAADSRLLLLVRSAFPLKACHDGLVQAAYLPTTLLVVEIVAGHVAAARLECPVT